MKILTLTSLFPNSVQPTRSIAGKYRAARLAKHCEVKVVSPVPYFPPLKRVKKWYVYSQIPAREYVDSVEVFHPRYFFLPLMGRPLHGLLYFLFMLPYLWRLKRKYDFDLIDAIWAYPDGYAAVLIGRLLKVPVTIRTIGSDIHQHRKAPSIKRLVVYALSNCNRAFTVCQALKDSMVEMGVPSENILVLYNGISLEGFYPNPSRDNNKKKLVFVGDVVQLKGVDCLIEAFAKVRYGNGSVELTVIGDGPLREPLTQRAAALGLADRVKFVGQRLHEDVAETVRGSDLLVLPSLAEGLPNVVIEAISSHVPVVSTRVGGIAEAAGRYGLLVDPGDPEGLARAIEEALETTWDFSDVDQHLSLFSWERNIAMTLQEFARLIDSAVPQNSR